MVCLLQSFAGAALADDSADDLDPPERVARVDIVEGAAAFQLAGTDEWNTDMANRPFTTGDKLWVDAGARADLHLGATAIRMGAETALQLLNAGDRATQLGLTGGSLNLRVRYLSPDESFEVDTPNLSVSILAPGEYRIDVDDTGTITSVAVFGGQVGIVGQAQDFTLQAREFGEFRGANELAVDFEDLPAPDAFDRWATLLDQREDQALTANFVSRDVTGYADLDDAGTWQTDPSEGPVWVPTVDPDWAPYSEGCWVWIAPWGWTWIDAAPWGFAPFHYGRWLKTRSGWAWAPGRLAVRPVYAPALVGWIGGAGFAARGSTVAWFPLGLNELYRPAYHVSDAYLRNVNVTNTDIDPAAWRDPPAGPHSRFVNQSVPGAVQAETRTAFLAAAPVARNRVPIEMVTVAKAPAGPSLPEPAPLPRSLVRAADPANPRMSAALATRADVRFARGVTARTIPPASQFALRHVMRVQVRLVAPHGPMPMPRADQGLARQRDAPRGSADRPAGVAPPPAMPRPDRPAAALPKVAPALPRNTEDRPPAAQTETRDPVARDPSRSLEPRNDGRAPTDEDRRSPEAEPPTARSPQRTSAGDGKPKEKPENKTPIKSEPH
jgi:hypothetical protein